MRPRSPLIVLYVADMAEAFAFYRDGLSLTPVMNSSGWSMLSCGDLSIGLHLIEPGVDERPVPYAGLNLLVEDLDAAITHAISHGAKLVRRVDSLRDDLPRLGVMLAPGGNGFELRDR